MSYLGAIINEFFFILCYSQIDAGNITKQVGSTFFPDII